MSVPSGRFRVTIEYTYHPERAMSHLCAAPGGGPTEWVFYICIPPNKYNSTTISRTVPPIPIPPPLPHLEYP